MQKISFQQQVITGFIITLVSVFFVGIMSYLSIKELQKDNGLVSLTKGVLSKTQEIEQHLTAAETSQRGYLITGQLSYLDSYNDRIGRVPFLIRDLQRMVSESPGQILRADSLAYYATAKHKAMEKVLAIYKEGSFDDARTELNKNRGKMYMDDIHRVVSDMRQEEQRALLERNANTEQSVERVVWIISLGSLFILSMVLILLGFIRKTFNERNQIEAALLETNKNLEMISGESENRNWLLAGSIVIDEAMRGLQEVDVRSKSIITEICKYLKADIGAIYVADELGDILKLTGTYAFKPEDGVSMFRLGEGLVGQVALERRGMVITDVPEDYIKVHSALGNTIPGALLLYPFIFQSQLKAVVEVGFINGVSPNAMKFFNQISNSVAVGINAAQARVQMQALIDRSQKQALELEAQQEELRTTNEELLNKTEELQASEEELRVQQEELRQANGELEEQAMLLEERNKAVNEAHEAISIKAEELEQTGKYKSEFLANMSHELRTPLNSILILARILGDNKHANLNEEQLKYARVIHNAGNDLLTLINDILDLSKVESGMMDLNLEEVYLKDIKSDLDLLFNEVAENKKIDFSVQLQPDIPDAIFSDRVRVEQIIRNLLSNAFKFTPEGGSVTVIVESGDTEQVFTSNILKSLDAKDIISISVTDTGIGIPEEKQRLIFEAFRQADGSTSRKYGGTGLGLSISRELAIVLGGEISVTSVQGSGSTFKLFLPVNLQPKESKEADINKKRDIPPVERINPLKVIENLPVAEETTVLIIEDDKDFSDILVDYAIDRGFKTIAAYSGDTGLEMAKKYQPNAIILDVMLPVMDGWKVLKQLKSNPETSKIPVHMMSAGDEKTLKAERAGAVGFVKKPVAKEHLDEVFNNLIKNGELKLAKVLVVEDHEIQSEDLKRKFVDHNIKVIQAFNGNEARQILQKEWDFDCLILDVNLPDISGLDLLDEIRSNEKLQNIPVIINTAMELDKSSMSRVLEHTDAMVLKNIKSNDRLLDEVNLFMNKLKTSAEVQVPYAKVNSSIPEKIFKDKTILIADDDMRNIFALSSALQSFELSIEAAHNGKEALTMLENRPDIDLVLMDIMMPEMDGYQAMIEIRKQNRFKNLPIIALTAKAMKSDREKCISAGANDYISKPIDIEKLLSLIRVWLS